jgi:hypothetical protein
LEPLVFLYVVSVYASLLGPVTAIGGIATGLLWGLRQYNFAVVALAVSGVLLGFLSAYYNPDAETNIHVYFVSSHLCALLLWAFFAGLVWRLIPEELPSVRRLRLQQRVKMRE